MKSIKDFARFLFIAVILVAFTQLTNANSTPNVEKLMNKDSQLNTTPAQALEILEQGNLRFVDSKMMQRNHLETANDTSMHGQHPFAIVLSCIDSRSIPETIFDQGIGDIFTARVAGNVVSSNIIASMEYATMVAGAKLIVVMGHTQCGAVHAACQGAAPGHINALVAQIKPAVVSVEKKLNRHDYSDPTLFNAIVKQNVINQINIILKDSPILRKMDDDHKIKIVGAIHNLKTGQVEFFNEVNS